MLQHIESAGRSPVRQSDRQCENLPSSAACHLLSMPFLDEQLLMLRCSWEGTKAGRVMRDITIKALDNEENRANVWNGSLDATEGTKLHGPKPQLEI